MLSWVHNEKRDSPFASTHPPSQAGPVDAMGDNKKARCSIPSATAGRGGQNLALFLGWWAGAQGGPYSLPVLGSIPSRSTNGNVT